MAGEPNLESWKEVSAYLKRSVRTCRRWENEFGLPIHRLEGKAKSRIWAAASELDRWVKDKLQLAEASETIRSLAVLPLRNLCGDKEKDYISEGLTEALITELGQIRAFRIISHQSVRQFQEKTSTAPEIAKMLGVAALVEGALLQATNRVRLSINLIGAYPEKHIWAKSYDCRESDIVSLPRQIAYAIAEQAGAGLTPQVEARLSSPQVVNYQAYEAYFRGKAFIRRSYLRADIEMALDYFEKAIENDPKFALAYAEKGWAYGQLGAYSHIEPKEAFHKLKEAAQKALELDPLLAEGYSQLGYAFSVYDWAWALAEQNLKRALELNPNSSRAYFNYAQFLIWVGRHDEALEAQRRLIEIDPLNPESHWNLGWNFFWAGRYDESIAVFKKLQERAPDDHWLQMALGVIYSINGMPKQAIEICEKARAGVPMGLDGQFDCFTAIIFAYAGEREKACNILEQLKKISKKRIVDSASLSGAYAALGDIQEAIRLLEKGYREHSPTMAYLKVGPFWNPLSADPRYQRILCALNFPSV